MTEEVTMGLEIIEGETRVPEVILPQRVGGEFVTLDTQQQFAGKRVIVFGLPGAFTPTCSTQQLPGFEEKFAEFQEKGIDEIYCVSVNDTFVMNAWMNSLDIQKVKPLPDGSGEFTRKMGFLVDKTNIGFGYRSWRYSMIVNDGLVEALFVEPGIEDNAEGDPFVVSGAPVMLEHLQG